MKGITGKATGRNMTPLTALRNKQDQAVQTDDAAIDGTTHGAAPAIVSLRFGRPSDPGSGPPAWQFTVMEVRFMARLIQDPSLRGDYLRDYGHEGGGARLLADTDWPGWLSLRAIIGGARFLLSLEGHNFDPTTSETAEILKQDMYFGLVPRWLLHYDWSPPGHLAEEAPRIYVKENPAALCPPYLQYLPYTNDLDGRHLETEFTSGRLPDIPGFEWRPLGDGWFRAGPLGGSAPAG